VKVLIKISSFLILLVVPVFGVGQVNLVPNPSFEDTLGCPMGYPDLDGVCESWDSYRLTPDYYNECSSVCGFVNQAGNQNPHWGKAYAGINMYQTTLTNASEHIGIQLTEVKYYCTFYVSPGWNYTTVNVACNKMGAAFFNSSYDDPTGSNAPINTAHIVCDSIINDTLTWYKIQGSFIADSNYEYLVIGNFFEDDTLDTLNFPNEFGPFGAYYYIDDVCVSTDSANCESLLSVVAEESEIQEIKLFPNPTSNYFNISSNAKINRLRIYSIDGSMLREITLNSTDITVNTTDLSSGLYLVKISYGQESVTKKLKIL